MVDLVKLKSLNSQYLRLRRYVYIMKLLCNFNNNLNSEEDMEKFMQEVKVIFEKEIGKEKLSSFPDSYIQSVIYLTTVCLHFLYTYCNSFTKITKIHSFKITE